MGIEIEGMGSDSPVVFNDSGAGQSDIPYGCHLLPPLAMLAAAKTLATGAKKYGAGNWMNIPIADHVNHAMTHLFCFLSGDTQEDHLVNALCRMMFAADIRKQEQHSAASGVKEAAEFHKMFERWMPPRDGVGGTDGVVPPRDRVVPPPPPGWGESSGSGVEPCTRAEPAVAWRILMASLDLGSLPATRVLGVFLDEEEAVGYAIRIGDGLKERKVRATVAVEPCDGRSLGFNVLRQNTDSEYMHMVGSFGTQSEAESFVRMMERAKEGGFVEATFHVEPAESRPND